MTSVKKENTGKTIALISFAIGTLIFGLYYFKPDSELMLFGLFYLAIAGIINTGFLIFLIFKAQKNKERKIDILKDSSWILVNIPIAFGYLWLIMILLNTVRLTLINPTETELTNIHLIGCDEKHIDNLKPGERETIWITINNDCSIDLKFKENNIDKTETVIGYTTPMNGQKVEHKIGLGNQEI